MPSFFSLHVLVSALVKWLLSGSRISTGEPAKSSFEVRGYFMIECPFLQMWVKLWHPICGYRPACQTRGYSVCRGRLIVVLTALAHWR